MYSFDLFIINASFSCIIIIGFSITSSMLTRSIYKKHAHLVATGENHQNFLFNQDASFVNKDRKNVGHWNQQEQFFYYIFLNKNKDRFMDKQIRKTQKIFREMGRFIKTRGADQCRSHHQKMEIKYPDFDHLLQFLHATCESVETDGLKVQEYENYSTCFNTYHENMNQLPLGDEEKFDKISFVSFEPLNEMQVPGVESFTMIDIFLPFCPELPFQN